MSEENEGGGVWRASQDPEPRLLPLPSEPVPLGARGDRASGWGRMGGGWDGPDALKGHFRVEASRVSRLAGANLGETWAAARTVKVRPRAPQPCPEPPPLGPAFARGPAAAAGAGDVAL